MKPHITNKNDINFADESIFVLKQAKYIQNQLEVYNLLNYF